MSRSNFSTVSSSKMFDISNSNIGDLQEEATWASPLLSVNMDTVDQLLTQTFVQKLFRLFLFFADPTFCDGVDDADLRADAALSSKKTISGEDAHYFCFLLSQYIVTQHLQTAEDNQAISARVNTDHDGKTFREFVQMLSDAFPVEKAKIEAAIDALYEKLIKQLFKKGYLLKQSKRTFSWNICWCIASPGRLTLHNVFKPSVLKKEYILSKLSYVKEERSSSPNKPLFKFLVRIANRTYLFATRDRLDQQEWITGIRLAIARCDVSRNYYLESHMKRNAKPADFVRRTKSEAPAPSTPMLSPGHNGKLVRYSYNGPAVFVDNRLSREMTRCSRLQDENNQLREQLVAEKQATKDEEIVRRLAVQMIEDERMEKERLLLVCRELQHQLDKERNERKDLEARLSIKRAEMEKIKYRLKHILNSDTGDYLIDRSLPRAFRTKAMEISELRNEILNSS